MDRVRPTVADFEEHRAECIVGVTDVEITRTSSVFAIDTIFHLDPSAATDWLSLAACTALITSAAVECGGSVAAELSVEDDVAGMDETTFVRYFLAP
jgi:hypothetical protein